VTVSCGHSHPAVTAAMCEQIATLMHTTTIYLNPQIALFAQVRASAGCTPLLSPHHNPDALGARCGATGARCPPAPWALVHLLHELWERSERPCCAARSPALRVSSEGRRGRHLPAQRLPRYVRGHDGADGSVHVEVPCRSARWLSPRSVPGYLQVRAVRAREVSTGAPGRTLAA
jgi:hypothetical protein